MLRRMPVAADHAPGVWADLDRVTLDDAVEGIGQPVDSHAEAAESRAIILEHLFGEPRRAIEAQGLRRRFLTGVGREIAAHQEFRARDPEFDVEFSHQPAGEADVIGVHVRNDYTLYAPALHWPGEELLPGLRRLFVLDAAVDDRPAIAI